MASLHGNGKKHHINIDLIAHNTKTIQPASNMLLNYETGSLTIIVYQHGSVSRRTNGHRRNERQARPGSNHTLEVSVWHLGGIHIANIV